MTIMARFATVVFVAMADYGYISNMGVRERTETYFRKRLKVERERRGWSQEELAKRLCDRKIDGVYASTIAKIEVGKRAVRMDEAAGIADLFDMSLDALLGRKGMEDDASHAMTVLADESLKMAADLAEARDRLRLAYEDLGAQFDFAYVDQALASGGDVLMAEDELTVEQRRANLMWICRESAMTHLTAATNLLNSIAAYRSMAATEIHKQWVSVMMLTGRE